MRRRYQVFKEQTWTALTSLRQLYHYHFINAEGPIAEVQANILNELKYQSSLELDPRTFERLRALPLAEELVVHAPAGAGQAARQLRAGTYPSF